MQETLFNLETLLQICGSTLRLSTPLIFAALGGFFAERSGVIDISLEGKMLFGACAGAVVAHMTGSPWFGAFAGGTAGMAAGAFYGIFAIQFKANQIVAGTALNLLAAGLVPFVLNILYATPGSSPALEMNERFLSEPVYFAWFLAAAIAVWLKFGRAGTWLSFAGENPAALATAGISVVKTRWAALLTGGFLAGLGGAALSLYLSSAYARNMTSGRGFMALAALILGNWKPLPSALACLLFGLVDALQLRLQVLESFSSEGSGTGGTGSAGGFHLPQQFVQVLPYLATIILTAWFFTKSRAPQALGKPWNSEST